MKTAFEEIGEYVEKETILREWLKDPECESIMILLLEEKGWEIH